LYAEFVFIRKNIKRGTGLVTATEQPEGVMNPESKIAVMQEEVWPVHKCHVLFSGERFPTWYRIT
jgi:hypothetical protein